MSDLTRQYGIPPESIKRGRRLKIAAWSAPFALAAVPAVLFFILSVITSGTPIFAVSIFVVGLVLTILGFIAGLVVSGIWGYRLSAWTAEMREKIAENGIRAGELDWFRNELKSSEKRALKSIESANVLLADAYRETLASRLTATRIVRSARRELQEAKRRQSKLKKLKHENAKTFADEITSDVREITRIAGEAQLMLQEAESRLQVIEAAALRGTKLAGHDLALKKLSARASELPLALEEARLTQELTSEAMKELETGAEKEEGPAKAHQ